MKNLLQYTNSELSEILSNAKTLSSTCVNMTNCYYVGGSLCVDIKEGDNTQVLLFNLNEMVTDFSTGESRLLSIDNVRNVFGVYKDVKGETKYYNESVKTSIMRHFV